jgi:glycosyltransferase involved in cell wall biosynthesis
MADREQQPAAGDQAGAHVPLLSVTVLNYNYAHYLPQCLDSILRQTFTDFELLLINDCSTDNSLDVIQPYLADPRVTLINHEQNQGYIASLIEGSDRSRGKYLTVISADDYCLSDRAFETLLRPMEADQDIAYAFSAFGIYGDDGNCLYLNRPIAESSVRAAPEQYRDLLRHGNIASHSGTIIRASAYRAVGGYDPAARYAIDLVMWLVLCGQGHTAYSSDELIAYRRHGANMSDSFPAIRGTIRDSLYGIDTSFATMRTHPEISPEMYTAALKRYLSHTTESLVFAGHYRGALYGLWSGLQLHPMLTVFQSRTLIMLARALLGHRGYDSARSWLKRAPVSAAPATSEK